ncbi:hypothetical protein GCM10017083_25930 [Thalassobaculum fulvum]|jgi:hypothetical protein|uniref:Uncharacterized protein n=1 Tax=Thalassobaculum fulvum TaxID=1633335 RepID=A0A918XT57_9PROT|nr:hypothetical protein [Thalassobaculum fulvum]GHD51456.1 hypothetical protein GCM10017083_25930 [Thalassobaculum fulvum]
MRHLPKFSDDYGPAADELTASAILSSDLDELIDAYGDDWSLADADEIELLQPVAH